MNTATQPDTDAIGGIAFASAVLATAIVGGFLLTLSLASWVLKLAAA